MNKRAKIILAVGAGALVLYLLYRYYESSQNSSAADQTAAEQASQGADGDSGGGDGGYGDLASALGQEANQEQSDVSTLTSGLSSLGTELQADEGTIGLQGTQIGTLQSQVAAEALGERSADTQLKRLTSTLGLHYGRKPPKAGKGFKWIGIGEGYWEKVRMTVKKDVARPKVNQAKTHQSVHKTRGAVAASTHETKPLTRVARPASATVTGSRKTPARTQTSARRKVRR